MRNLWSKIFLLVMLGLSVPATTSQAASAFIEGMEDVPLMRGLAQKASDDISFGNAETRYVEALLSSSKVGFKAVEKFYSDTLPQLGWTYQGKRDNTLIFYRDGEALTIVREESRPLKVRITVRSRI